jgi:hypothetical protein
VNSAEATGWERGFGNMLLEYVRLKYVMLIGANIPMDYPVLTCHPRRFEINAGLHGSWLYLDFCASVPPPPVSSHEQHSLMIQPILCTPTCSMLGMHTRAMSRHCFPTSCTCAGGANSAPRQNMSYLGLSSDRRSEN